MELDDLKKECEWCGNLYVPKAGNQRFCCKECSKEYNRKTMRLHMRKIRQLEYEKMKIVKHCEICGNEFYTTNPRKTVCSPECSRERARIRNAEYRSLHRKKKITFDGFTEEGISYSYLEQQKKSKKKIDDVDAKAKALGMSYGQYVALQYMKEGR